MASDGPPKAAPFVTELDVPLPVAEPLVSTVRVVADGVDIILKSPFISSAVRPLVSLKPASVTN